MKMIIIEGNIGAGKSTLTKKLAERINARAFYEPVEANPYLDKFYKDPQKYALSMQFYLMSVRYEMHLEGIKYIWRTGNPVIYDRSIYGDYVFAKKNWLDGNMSDLDFENYNKMRNVMFRSLMIPHITLYLNNDPEKTAKNIRERSRDCEQEIPIEYLKGLSDLYKEFSAEMRGLGSRVVDLDWNEFRSVDYVMERMGDITQGISYPQIQGPDPAFTPAFNSSIDASLDSLKM